MTAWIHGEMWTWKLPHAHTSPSLLRHQPFFQKAVLFPATRFNHRLTNQNKKRTRNHPADPHQPKAKRTEDVKTRASCSGLNSQPAELSFWSTAYRTVSYGYPTSSQLGRSQERHLPQGQRKRPERDLISGRKAGILLLNWSSLGKFGAFFRGEVASGGCCVFNDCIVIQYIPSLDGVFCWGQNIYRTIRRTNNENTFSMNHFQCQFSRLSEVLTVYVG